jgi:hypothetical protein
MTLKKFEGKPVELVRAAITGAGDGLSKSLAIEPAEHKSGDDIYVVIKCRVGKITHDPTDDAGDAFERVEQFKAKIVTIVDADLVKAAIDEQYERNLQYDAERKGQLSFPTPGDDPDGD